MAIETPHFFHVPVRYLSDATGAYQLYYDFDKVQVTYELSVILYEMVEAPAGARITKIEVTSKENPVVPFQPFTGANGRLAGLFDTDPNNGNPGTFAVHITVSYNGQDTVSDPQIINNPIRR